MNIGYCRVSTDVQNTRLQKDALLSFGCQKIFTDEGISGGRFDRPGLNAAIDAASAGDTIVIWKLDRLGRSLSELIRIVALLGDDQIGLVSISEAIDTNSAGGRLLFHIMGALAEFERALISERTKAGMLAARSAGRQLGRPRKLDEATTRAIERRLLGSQNSMIDVARTLGVSRATLYRSLKRIKHLKSR